MSASWALSTSLESDFCSVFLSSFFSSFLSSAREAASRATSMAAQTTRRRNWYMTEVPWVAFRSCSPHSDGARGPGVRGFASHSQLPLSGSGHVRSEAASEGILRDSARQQELQQVIGPAGLRADARQAEAAERLAIDQGAGDLAVDVEVAHAELALDPLDVRRAAREQPAGQRVGHVVGDADGVAEVLRLRHRQDGAEELVLPQERPRIDVGEDVRRDVIPLLREARRQRAGVGDARLLLRPL